MTTCHAEPVARGSRVAAQGNFFSNFQAAFGNLLVRGADALIDSLEDGRNMRHLKSLDEHMLRDIGLSRADVDAMDHKVR